MKFSQLVESSKRHAKEPYLFFLETKLPSGITLRFARDRQSWVWPLTGSSHATLTFPADACVFSTQNNLALAVQGGFVGHIALEQQLDDGTWAEITRYSRRIEENVTVDNGTFRLCAAADFRGTAKVHLGDAAMPLWQAMAFEFDDFKSGEGARRGTLNVSISNASGIALKYIDELEDWRKKHGRYSVQCRFLVVNAGLLDDPEPFKELSLTDTQISCPPPMDKVVFTLGSRNVWAWTLNRKIMATYCSWKRKEECPHVAECNHSIDACRTIFKNTMNFGGFPMMGRGALFGA